MLVHINNYAYGFGAGRGGRSKGYLVLPECHRYLCVFDIIMFLLLLPVVGLPLGFMQNNGRASAGLAQEFTYGTCLHHRGRSLICRVYIHY